MNPLESPLHALLLYCRPGFEKECAAEIQERASGLGACGFAKAKPDTGFVLFAPYAPEAAAQLWRRLRFAEMVFARQILCVSPQLNGLPVNDRIAPLLAAARGLGQGFSQVWLETADTNEAKSLAGFTRKFAQPLQNALAQAGLAKPDLHAPRLHLFFLNSTSVYLGLSRPGDSSPWPMGIPRLKFPRAAPSRSTLKLEEAFLTFLPENSQALQAGMKAVDLGAAPGGWTWQLAKRSLRVTAVDNADLAPALLESGVVEHLRVDGFRYKPPKPVDWLVCDMAEQPSRIAALIARWAAAGDCRHAVFNLKLPMKKRYEEVQRCRALIEDGLAQSDSGFHLAFRQLYHDREEVTGYLARLSP
jgi:23S rRNA (cytidine2498-2'-O)-methyltransferase